MKIYIKRILFISFFLTATIQLAAQQDTITDIEKLQKRLDNLESVVGRIKNVTFSGYFQMQYLYAQPQAILRLGSPNEDLDSNFSRIGIRRSRIKATYEEGLGSAVFQLDFSDRGIVIRDAYLKFKDPWVKTNYFQTGIFFRPFGDDVRLSSSRRETPERSRVVLTLFPGERDLGGMVHLEAPKTSPLHIFVLDAGLIAGNGVNQETDSRRDFIGSMRAVPHLGNNLSLSVGASYYLGSVFQGTENVFTMEGDGFVENSNRDNIGRYARREYFGFDSQMRYTFVPAIGQSRLRIEYIWGQQPGSRESSVSPNSPFRPNHDTYIRSFQGGYFIFVQDVGKLPFMVLTRYDWYDPNTKVSGDNIGLRHTNQTDIMRSAWGIGAIWKANNRTQLQAYYEINENEKSIHVPGFETNRKDNIFALTLQLIY